MENWNRNLYKYNYGRNNALKLQVVGDRTSRRRRRWRFAAAVATSIAFDLSSGNMNVDDFEDSCTAETDAVATKASVETMNEQKALKQAKFNIINLSCEV